MRTQVDYIHRSTRGLGRAVQSPRRLWSGMVLRDSSQARDCSIILRASLGFGAKRHDRCLIFGGFPKLNSVTIRLLSADRRSWAFHKSEVEGCEYQDDSYIHR